MQARNNMYKAKKLLVIGMIELIKAPNVAQMQCKSN